MSPDDALSLRSAVKLLRVVLHQSALPPTRQAKAEEALRRFMAAVFDNAELPDATEYRRRHAA